jgi:hypothetical protein
MRPVGKEQRRVQFAKNNWLRALAFFPNQNDNASYYGRADCIAALEFIKRFVRKTLRAVD